MNGEDMHEEKQKNCNYTTTSMKHSWKPHGWIADFRVFAESTTAHGINHMFVGRNRFVRMLFVISWLAAVVYTCYMIMTSIITFINKPTGTKYEIYVDKHDNINKPQTIKFPTISICSHNKVKKSYLHKAGNEGIRHYWSAIDMYDTTEAKKMNWSNPAYEEIADYTYQQVLSDGGPDDNRLLFCQQRRKECKDLLPNPGRFFVREESITGKCWRVNPDGILKGKGGDYGKLQLMLFADLQDYTLRSADQPQYGFIVAFHDNSVYGSTLSSGYFMSPGSIYKVDLRLKSEKREPPPGGNCNASLVDTTYGAYHEGACVMECKDKYIADRCNCVNIVPPLTIAGKPRYRSCTLKEWAECGMDAYLNFSKLYEDTDLPMNICPCPAACKETYYEAQLSSSSLSPHYVDNLFGMKRIKNYLGHASHSEYGVVYNTSQDIMDNVVVVELLFTSMATSQIVQVVTYTSANLLGDIGGVLGLFLGASLFTIIEFVQFVGFAIAKHCFSKCNKGGRESPTLVIE